MTPVSESLTVRRGRNDSDEVSARRRYGNGMARAAVLDICLCVIVGLWHPCACVCAHRLCLSPSLLHLSRSVGLHHRLSLSLSLSARAASAQWGATRDVPVPHTARGNRRGTSPAPRAGDTHPMHRGTSRGRSGEAPEAALRRVQDARSRRSATIIIINNNNS